MANTMTPKINTSHTKARIRTTDAFSEFGYSVEEIKQIAQDFLVVLKKCEVLKIDLSSFQVMFDIVTTLERHFCSQLRLSGHGTRSTSKSKSAPNSDYNGVIKTPSQLKNRARSYVDVLSSQSQFKAINRSSSFTTSEFHKIQDNPVPTSLMVKVDSRSGTNYAILDLTTPDEGIEERNGTLDKWTSLVGVNLSSKHIDHTSSVASLLDPESYNVTPHNRNRRSQRIRKRKTWFSKDHNTRITTGAVQNKPKSSKKETIADVNSTKAAKLRHTGSPVNGHYSCTMCGKTFTVLTHLEAHLLIHLIGNGNPRKNREKEAYKNVVLKCPECFKTVKNARTLRFHKAIHKGDWVYECNICGKKFLRYRLHDLRRHIRKTHGKSQDVVMNFVLNKEKGSQIKSNTKKETRQMCESLHHLKAIPPRKFQHHLDVHVDERSYACYLCDKSFAPKGKHILKQHLEKKHLIHEEDMEKYIRYLSADHFKDKQRLDTWNLNDSDQNTDIVPVVESADHSQGHDEVQPCVICGKAFESMKALLSHILSHEKLDSSQKMTSSLSGTEDWESDKSSTLNQHDCIGTSFVDPTIKCTEQSKMLQESRAVTLNQKAEKIGGLSIAWHGERECERSSIGSILNKELKLKCPLCPKVLKHPCLLKYHIYVHLNAKSYACKICDRRFLKHRKADLRRHIWKIHGKMDAEEYMINLSEDKDQHKTIFQSAPRKERKTKKCCYCTICNKSFCRIYELKRHLKQIHDTEIDIKYLRVLTMESNKNVPTIEKNQSLLENEGFGDQQNYPSTNGVYIAKQNFEVSKTVKNSSTVQKAVTAKEAASPFICFYCKKDCLCKKYLLQHLWTHERTKRFKCQFCDKSYNRVYEMARHMKQAHMKEYVLNSFTNKGTNKYTCTLCGTKFKTMRILKRHVLNVHEGEKKNRCTICSKSFIRFSDAKRHIRQVHDKDVQLMDLGTFVDRLGDEEDSSKKEEYDGGNDSACDSNAEGKLVQIEDTSNHAMHKMRMNSHHTPSSDQNFENEYVNEESNSCLDNEKELKDGEGLEQKRAAYELPQQKKCDLCGEMFFRLDRHKWDAHKVDSSATVEKYLTEVALVKNEAEKFSLCILCGNKFSSDEEESGMCKDCKPVSQQATLPSPFTCNICGFKFREMLRWKKHLSTHSSAKPFRCKQCSKSFKTKKGLEIHNLEHSNTGESCCCDVCGLMFSCQYKVRRHKHNVHLKERKKIQLLVCLTCSLRCRSREQLWNHMEIHTGDDQMICLFCDKTFKGAKDLTKHARSLHSQTDHPYLCTHCDSCFRDRDQLLAHLDLTHQEQKTFTCAFCEAKFSLEYDLKFHMMQHEKKVRKKQSGSVRNLALKGLYKGPFHCEACGKIFQRKLSLDVHMRIHTNTFDYPCDFCVKKFKSPAELRIHRRGHTKEKPYACPFCEAKFSRHSTWIRHKRGHLGVRLYLCDLCGGQFTSKRGMNRHKLIHDRENEKQEVSLDPQTFSVSQDNMQYPPTDLVKTEGTSYVTEEASVMDKTDMNTTSYVIEDVAAVTDLERATLSYVIEGSQMLLSENTLAGSSLIVPGESIVIEAGGTNIIFANGIYQPGV